MATTGEPNAKTYAEVAASTPPAMGQSVSKSEENKTNSDTAPVVQAMAELPPQTNGNYLHGDSSTISAIQPPTPDEYTGTGLDDGSLSPVRSRHRKTGSRGSGKRNNISNMKSSSSTSSESSVLDANGYKLIYEKYIDGTGGRLTSVKPSDDYELNIKQGEMEKKMNWSTKGELDLVSGRQAAAGWERSG